VLLVLAGVAAMRPWRARDRRVASYAEA
jgi:hypothetical protein